MTDAPEESQEPGAPKEPQYKEVSETELKRVLAEHEKWLQTDGEEGAQANLTGAKLQRANLRDADLQGAILRDADLQRANLYGANLYGANLSGANLSGAVLGVPDLKLNTELTQQQLSSACSDPESPPRLPRGFEPPPSCAN